MGASNRMKETSFIRLTEDDLVKIDVVMGSIDESTTRNQIVRGGIDIMFANALRFLYRSGDINDDQLDDLLYLLEDYHAEKTRKEIESEMAVKNG